MDEYSTVAETFARAQMTLLQEWPHLEARLSVQQDVLRSGTFLVESEETRAKCRAPNAKGQRPCKGFAGEVSPRIEKKRVGQKQRVCLMTHIPKPSGSVTVTVSGDLLRRVSGVRIGIPDKQAKLPGGKVSITVDVDGERAVTASLTGKHNVAELDFPHAGDRLTVRVSSEDGTNRPVCLMFSDAAWYNRE